MLPDPTIALFRETNLVSDDQMAAIAAALQIQIDRDFRPVWGLGATVISVRPGGIIPANAWEIIAMDHCDLADALGYHDQNGPGGVPRSIIGVRDDLDSGGAISTTFGHEFFEMRVNPFLDQVARQTLPNGHVLERAKEVCDACEDDQFGIVINGLAMTAWATPAWFDPNGKGPFTFPEIPSINAPFMLAEGGYIPAHEVWPVLQPWDQLMAEGKPGRRAINKHHRSRTMRILNQRLTV
jgi:hypothetical protein